jgi:hypothetical protein
MSHTATDKAASLAVTAAREAKNMPIMMQRGASLRPIRTRFRRGGFDYRQIAREGDWAIYEQRWRGSENVAYEVVRIRLGSGLLLGQEVYPSFEKWGVDAKTLTDRDAAFHKLREIAASLNAPARVGQKRKRSRPGKSPTRRTARKITHKTKLKIAYKTASKIALILLIQSPCAG